MNGLNPSSPLHHHCQEESSICMLPHCNTLPNHPSVPPPPPHRPPSSRRPKGAMQPGRDPARVEARVPGDFRTKPPRMLFQSGRPEERVERSWLRKATKAVLFLSVARGGSRSRGFGEDNLACPAKRQEMLMRLAAPGEEGSTEVSGKTPPGARCVPGGWMLVGDRSEGGCRHEPNFQTGDGKRSGQQYCSSTWRPALSHAGRAMHRNGQRQLKT